MVLPLTYRFDCILIKEKVTLLYERLRIKGDSLKVSQIRGELRYLCNLHCIRVIFVQSSSFQSDLKIIKCRINIVLLRLVARQRTASRSSLPAKNQQNSMRNLTHNRIKLWTK